MLKEFVFEMAKKDLNNSSVLLNLYHNKLLVSKVDEALDEGKPYDFIIAFCKEKFDFEISKPALSRYKEKRREAIEQGVDLESLLDKRRKSGKVIDLKGKEVETLPNTNTSYDQTFNAVEQIYNDVEVLDTIIQKGFASLKEVDYVEAPLAMKAIEVKAKVTGNQMQGLSLVGLRELRLRQSAKEQAMTEVILRFIPEEQHEEVYQAIEEAEAEFYENLDLTAENARITQALEQAGMNII